MANRSCVLKKNKKLVNQSRDYQACKFTVGIPWTSIKMLSLSVVSHVVIKEQTNINLVSKFFYVFAEKNSNFDRFKNRYYKKNN